MDTVGKIALLFSGQGAQYAGMGKSLYECSPAARRALDLAEKVRPGTLSQCFSGPEQVLSQTINTQPCLFAVDYACAQAVLEAGITPECAAGFSLGEVAAAAFAGVFSFEEGMRLTVRRAELMQECAARHPGAMLAILRLAQEQVEEICRQVGNAYPVNHNCPSQTVVACAEDAVEPLARAAGALRGRAVRLNVSGPFHSPWMEEAAAGLGAYLKGMSLLAPRIPLYANATAQPYGEDGAALLARQVCSPVLWRETLERMALDGVTAFVEVGAGATLCALVKKTLPGAAPLHVEDAQSLKETLEGMAHGA